MKVIDYKKFHLSKLTYEKPIKVKGGCLLTKTKYRINNTDIPIYIQSPKLKTLSGLVLNESRSYIDLELDKNHLGFYEFITNIDESNVNITHTNSEEWFGQNLPMDVIDDFYNSPLKMSKIDKAPNVKFKVPVSKGRPLCEIFGDNSRPLGVEHIKKDIDVVCILELIGIKYYKQRFECEWQVIQMRAFIDDYVPKACLIDETLMTDFEKEPEMFTVNTDTPQNTNESNTVEESTVPTETPTVEESTVPTETPTVEESNAPTETFTIEESTAPNETFTIEESTAPNETSTVEESTAPTETFTVEESSAPTETSTVEESSAPTETSTVEELNADTESSIVVETLENTESEGQMNESLEQNNLNIEELELDEDLDNLSDENDSEGELDLETDELELLDESSDTESELESEGSDDISDLDDNIEEIYLDGDSSEEEESESEDSEGDIDLDLEEVNLEGGIKNLMNEIDELKNIAVEKEAELKQIRQLDSEA